MRAAENLGRFTPPAPSASSHNGPINNAGALSSEPGYGSVRRFASEASTHVGVWVNVITAEVLAAQVAAEPL